MDPPGGGTDCAEAVPTSASPDTIDATITDLSMRALLTRACRVRRAPPSPIRHGANPLTAGVEVDAGADGDRGAGLGRHQAGAAVGLGLVGGDAVGDGDRGEN